MLAAPSKTRSADVVGRIASWHRQLIAPRCATTGCRRRAAADGKHCPRHRDEHRPRLRGRACADETCVRPRLFWAAVCAEHLRDDIARGRRDDPRYEQRLAVPVVDRPAGLIVVYEAHTDPGRNYTYAGLATHRHRAVPERVRVYLRAYVDESPAGHLAFGLHSGGTAFIKLLDVEGAYQRCGVASALYDTLRAEHPEILLDHGARSAAGQLWWIGYCRKRGLDPDDHATDTRASGRRS
jgi:GNAT superfamily N-acetyltransferase